jgi:hypothetical protein
MRPSLIIILLVLAGLVAALCMNTADRPRKPLRKIDPVEAKSTSESESQIIGK